MTQFTAIFVHGSDAARFLQGQLTQNMDVVTAGHCPLAAWCSPRGRVIAVMRLLAEPAGFALVIPGDLAPRVTRGLTLYRLRAAVEFAGPPDDWRAFAVAAEDDLRRLEAASLLPAARRDAAVAAPGIHAVCLDENRHVVEIYGRAAALGAAGLAFGSPLAGDDWLAARIAAGIADITADASDRYTPHMLNLDRLGAVSFDKGCYTGQEVVARTQHRGSAKRRIAHYRAAAALPAGTAVTDDGNEVGEIIAAAGVEVLALVPVDRHGRGLRAAGTDLQPAA